MRLRDLTRRDPGEGRRIVNEHDPHRQPRADALDAEELLARLQRYAARHARIVPTPEHDPTVDVMLDVTEDIRLDVTDDERRSSEKVEPFAWMNRRASDRRPTDAAVASPVPAAEFG